MSWFDVLKDAKEDAEEFFNNSLDSLINYFNDMEKRMLVELDRLDLATEMTENLTEFEREILKPMLDVLDRQKKETLDIAHNNLDLIRSARSELIKTKEETKDAPPELKIRVLSEKFQNLGTNPEGYPKMPTIDQDKIDDILHRLGFEGKGME